MRAGTVADILDGFLGAAAGAQFEAEAVDHYPAGVGQTGANLDSGGFRNAGGDYRDIAKLAFRMQRSAINMLGRPAAGDGI